MRLAISKLFFAIMDDRLALFIDKYIINPIPSAKPRVLSDTLLLSKGKGCGPAVF
jgi:hypothetical protein